jgi:hypothetical protein
VDIEVGGSIGEECVKDVKKETMTSISCCCIIKGPNLHVAKAHFRRTLMELRATIFRIDYLVR